MSLLTPLAVFRTEGVPFLVRHQLRRTEPRKNDHPVAHAGDAREQSRHGRRGRGHSGGDRESRRRLRFPALGHPAKQPVAPIRQVDHPALLENARPGRINDLQPFERMLPVPGELVAFADRLAQPRRLDFLDAQGVEGSSEIGREPQPFGGRVTRHDRGQHQQAIDRIDRRRNRRTLIDRVERAADPIVELGIADRDQARKQQAAAARPNEGLGDSPDRAVVRKQDPAARELQRIAPVPRQQAGDEGVGERPVGGNEEDGRALRPVRHLPRSLR